jgi:hypothetical protein
MFRWRCTAWRTAFDRGELLYRLDDSVIVRKSQGVSPWLIPAELREVQ